jgi:hypothetical protein
MSTVYVETSPYCKQQSFFATKNIWKYKHNVTIFTRLLEFDF